MITLSLVLGVVLALILHLTAAYPLWQSLAAGMGVAAIVLVVELPLCWLLKRPAPLWRPEIKPLLRSFKSFLLMFALILIVKCIWSPLFFLSGEKLLAGEERESLLERRAWLLENVAVSSFSLDQMPSLFAKHMKQEWAIGSLSMATGALANLAFLYPETRDENIAAVTTMIERVLKPDLEEFERFWWGEGALDTLQGNNGHAGYLGHLNFMLGAFRMLGGDGRYDVLHTDISRALARRMLSSQHHFLETFPRAIFIPDTSVVVASLAIAGKVLDEKYDEAISAWLDYVKANLIDPSTGIIRPWITTEGEAFGPARGSYAAWTNYYLNWIDKDLARAQYRLLKEQFASNLPFGGAALREYRRDYFGPADVDSGPVIFGLSTSGTGFMVAGARLNRDAAYLEGLLRTAEFVGSTLRFNNTQRYLLAPVVGDAIMLAMMSACDWDGRFLEKGSQETEGSASAGGAEARQN